MEWTGGRWRWGGADRHVKGGHLSLLALTSIPCSTWHPSHAIDINHDFSIIDPLSAMEGKNVLLILILVSSLSSFPHFDSAQWCIIIIKHYWFGIHGMPGKVCFTRLNLDAWDTKRADQNTGCFLCIFSWSHSETHSHHKENMKRKSNYLVQAPFLSAHKTK